MTHSATSDDLLKYRSSKKYSKIRAAVFEPRVIFTAQINQSFTSLDGVLELTYDNAVGSIEDVLFNMTALIGSTEGSHDIGICRIRGIDETTVYINQTADIEFDDDQYITVINDHGLWARHLLIDNNEVVYMDGGITYSDQHTKFDPIPIMGSHRVLKLVGANVSASFDLSDSYVVDGTLITAYVTTAPTADSITNANTSFPTVVFDSVGWHAVYSTVTAANGKFFTGVRYVYVWDDENKPHTAEINSISADVETGGWFADITLYSLATQEHVRDRSLVILFTEDYYDDSVAVIGPVEGSENVLFTGWVSKEEIHWDAETGSVGLTIYGAHKWLQSIPAYPVGVELVTSTPSHWTSVQALTLDKGLFHFLHWRTTATNIMDVFLTGDTKYTKEVSSLASTLWEQVRELAWSQIYARPGVNAQGQMFIEVHPQLVPTAERDWPVVMDITKKDWQGSIDFERVTVTPCAVVSLSGVSVNVSGSGTAFFSLAPGRTYSHYGSIDVQDRLLLEDQTKSNALAGLYRSYLNNEYPDISIRLASDVKLIDCFPRQMCSITIEPEDTQRGIGYTGRLIPTSVSVVHDSETGYLYREVSFEAETFESLSVDGDIPGGREDPSNPPSLPPMQLPPLSPLIPGGVPDSPYAGGPPKVLLHDVNAGLLLSTDFDNAAPTWNLVNGGLTSLQYRSINFIQVSISGAVYVASVRSEWYDKGWIARAPYIGAPFTMIVDCNDPVVNGGASEFFLHTCGINPLVPNQLLFEMGNIASPIIYTSDGVTYTAKAGGVAGPFTSPDALSYGFGSWIRTTYNGFAKFSTDGTPSGGGPCSAVPWHMRASTTGIIYYERNGDNKLIKTTNNLAGGETIVNNEANLISNLRYADCDPTGQLIMARAVGGKGKSADWGSSFAPLPNLPPGNYWFRYAGKQGESIGSSRWVAAGGSVVRLTLNWGNTWLNREGNLGIIVPLANINMVRVLEY